MQISIISSMKKRKLSNALVVSELVSMSQNATLLFTIRYWLGRPYGMHINIIEEKDKFLVEIHCLSHRIIFR